MVASSTAWHARLKPMNSRRTPRCTTAVSMRDRGGVLSMARTCELAPRAAVGQPHARDHDRAGAVGYDGFEIAARANTRTSSTRLTTAARVAVTLR